MQKPYLPAGNSMIATTKNERYSIRETRPEDEAAQDFQAADSIEMLSF